MCLLPEDQMTQFEEFLSILAVWRLTIDEGYYFAIQKFYRWEMWLLSEDQEVSQTTKFGEFLSNLAEIV